ncbi:sensor histidine kinase [Tannockella kyphosi]|uniref:sensor histidine kinase n=1 Tax=Tannockella kyphosi TaxID=2899121 RepID=UPI002010E1BE|nr:HAMP domain-containing sensor histidine kinase [Tannockella kyphosi]
MKKSFQTRITFIFGALIICMLGIQIVFNIGFSKEYFIAKKEQEVQELFDKIKENFENNTETLYGLTSQENEISGISVIIFSEDTMIYSTRLSSIVPIKPLELQAFSGDPEAGVLASMEDDLMEVVGLQGSFEYEDQTIYVSLSAPVESIENSISLFTEASIMIAIFVIIFGGIVVYIASKNLTRPILEVESVAKKVAKLDFSSKANEKASSYEMESLSKSINEMSAQLHNTIIELQKDIDYQKENEEMKKQFIANVSHEMKTPLALLQIYTESLQSNTPGIDKEMYYTVILEETKRLDAIVKDMLNLSNIEHGLSKMHFEEIYLTGLCHEVLQTYQFLTSEYQLQLSIDGEVYVHGDRKQLQEAMRNYINNAISHVSKEGHIKICLDKQEDKVVFSVYNDGNKIEDEKIKQIWNSFYKVDESRTRTKGVHAGLGLHIVKIIIQHHKGRFFVENKEKGVEFSFSLPTYQKTSSNK